MAAVTVAVVILIFSMRKAYTPVIFLLLISSRLLAGDIDKKTTVHPVPQKKWDTFSLSQVRLLPGSPFYKAMMVDQQYLLDADIDRALNGYRRAANLPAKMNYPGSNQPEGTRPVDLNHYLSAVALMYGQTGDKRFLEREQYIVKTLKECGDKLVIQKKGSDTLINKHLNKSLQTILNSRITLEGPDETGYPWDGTMGNEWYGIHKHLAGLRDAYLYCDDREAYNLLIGQANTITDFALRVNPDIFDDMLDIEHGGMNEVFADMYAFTGNPKYMEVSRRFNHQKVILNIATGNDVLYGRHVNMQVPTFVGTARQYQLTGNKVSYDATKNYLDIVYHSYMSCIGGSGRYERYNRPGEITKSLGYTADETCATYNMLKVALNFFESTGDLQHMDYFERGLYNHILASQDPDSGGVTYYTSLMPGGFKVFSKGFDLAGVWCCVGTGMENHAKYGEAIYFHNNTDVLVNLFIPSTVNWDEKGLKLKTETSFPQNDVVNMLVEDNVNFKGKLQIRYPHWATKPVKIWINGFAVQVTAKPGQYIALSHRWKKGDKIKLEIPQTFRVEQTPDDPDMAAIFHGPLVMAGELGAARMPGSDLVKHALNVYNEWVPPTDDIAVLVADKNDLAKYITRQASQPDAYTFDAGMLNGKKTPVSLVPYYRIRHERYNVYWKMFSPAGFAKRKQVVSDEINTASATDNTNHHLTGENQDTSKFKDNRRFWENNRPGMFAKKGGWFSYEMTPGNNKEPQYLTVTYWGSSSNKSNFDVLINGQLLAREELYDKWPITYYEEHYKIPQQLIKPNQKLTVKFQAKPGQEAGGVFGLKLSSSLTQFSGYLYY